MGGRTNRMNTLEINLATQGLANYVIKAFPDKAKKGTLSAVIAYDSRLNSDVVAEATALIFAANGIKAYLFSGLRPTPELSFAIRELKAATGVVVTASHNPRMYNGYKAYWNDGAQVIEPHDNGIIEEVNKVSSRTLKPFDHIGHCESLAGTGDTQKSDIADPGIARIAQLIYRLRSEERRV